MGSAAHQEIFSEKRQIWNDQLGKNIVVKKTSPHFPPPQLIKKIIIITFLFPSPATQPENHSGNTGRAFAGRGNQKNMLETKGM